MGTRTNQSQRTSGGHVLGAVALTISAVVAPLLTLAPSAHGAVTSTIRPSADRPHLTQAAVTPVAGAAYAADAPDPNVVRVGSTYYAYTTGTTWGNHIGVLIDTSGSPAGGWQTINGLSYGSSALPTVPAWQQINTQTSPGVFEWAGTWYLYYDAYDPALGHTCLSVATSTTPAGPFTDTSSAPFECQTSLGGSVDPSPFVDPATGSAWLTWKSNDGSSAGSAQLWSAPISPNGTGLAGQPTLLLTQDTVSHPWESTVENPDLIDVNGTYVLLFSGGIWNSAGYAESYAICTGPAGPCQQPTVGPILSSYGTVAGPGAGSAFTDASGQWWLAFDGWSSGCTSYACGGARELHMGTMTFTATSATPPPATPPTVGPAFGTVTLVSDPQASGYWVATSTGSIFSFGNAGFYGSTGAMALKRPIVGMAATPDGKGYWLVASDGGIFAFGDAGFYGSTGAMALNRPIVGMASTPNGGGYWLVASDGGIFAFGDAGFYGSTGAMALNRPIVGMATAPNGGGYWLVASDGGIFAFGDAAFYGSTGAMALNRPIVGMATAPNGGGYWLVASDGGIFAFGDAAFYGSTGAMALNRPIVGMATAPNGGGYWLVASDGGIFAFGNAPFEGSAGG